MPPTTVEPPHCEMPAEIWLKPLLTISPSVLLKNATDWFVTSTAIEPNRRSAHEASHPRFASRWPQLRRSLGGRFPGPRRSGLLSLAFATAVLRSAARDARTTRTSRPIPQRASLLHRQSALETPLVPAGLWL